MNLEESLNYRRAVRVFDKSKPIDPEKVRHCLELAALAPSSSNMQLWECYQITQPELMSKISEACLGQAATATASESDRGGALPVDWVVMDDFTDIANMAYTSSDLTSVKNYLRSKSYNYRYSNADVDRLMIAYERCVQ